MSKSKTGLWSQWSGGIGNMGRNGEDRDQWSGSDMWNSKMDQKGQILELGTGM